MDLKSDSFYLSEKHPDKLVNEGVFTIFNELDQVKNELRALLKPNGSQQAPARSCYDLFLCNPSFDEGRRDQWCILLTYIAINYIATAGEKSTSLHCRVFFPL